MEAGAPLEGKRFCHDGRNHILPVCCLHLGGEVALPCHRVRATAQRQAARAPSPPSPAVARPAPTGPSSLAHPPLPFLFSRLPGRPSVRHLDVTETAGRFTLFLPSSAALSRDSQLVLRRPSLQRAALTTARRVRRSAWTGLVGGKSSMHLGCFFIFKSCSWFWWRMFGDGSRPTRVNPSRSSSQRCDDCN